MTPDALVKTWFEEVWNQGKEDAIDRLMAPDALIHDLPTADGAPMVGPAAFKPFYQRFRAALPDVRIQVVRTVVNGEFVAAHCRVTGTHSGDTLGVPPSSRSVSFSGMAIARVRNGQIAEGWNCFDFLTLYQQVGVLPALPA